MGGTSTTTATGTNTGITTTGSMGGASTTASTGTNTGITTTGSMGGTSTTTSTGSNTGITTMGSTTSTGNTIGTTTSGDTGSTAATSSSLTIGNTDSSSMFTPLDVGSNSGSGLAKPSRPTNAFEDDWNLLAPSHEIIGRVKRDNSDLVSSSEIFDYLHRVKENATLVYDTNIYKFDRTMRCATAGLREYGKDSITEAEFHGLVNWMYRNCTASMDYIDNSLVGDNSGSIADVTSPSKSQDTTKTELYLAIKKRFMDEESEVEGSAKADSVHAQVDLGRRTKLLTCIETASQRFNYLDASLRPEDLDAVTTWVRGECMKA